MRPVLAPSDEEQRAIAEVATSVDRYAQRVLDKHTRPSIEFPDTEPTPEPTLLDRALQVERDKIDAEIDRLLRKSEPTE